MLSSTTTILFMQVGGGGGKGGDWTTEQLHFSSVADMDGKPNFISLKVSNLFNNPDTYRDNKFTSSVR